MAGTLAGMSQDWRYWPCSKDSLSPLYNPLTMGCPLLTPLCSERIQPWKQRTKGDKILFPRRSSKTALIKYQTNPAVSVKYFDSCYVSLWYKSQLTLKTCQRWVSKKVPRAKALAFKRDNLSSTYTEGESQLRHIVFWSPRVQNK